MGSHWVAMPEELKSCRVCKKAVAEYASSCPHCGANHPADLDYSPVEAESAEPVAEAVKPEQPTAKAPVISIHDAAKKGDIETVKQHIAAGTDVKAKDDVHGRTPLHLAAREGHMEIADLLRKHGSETTIETDLARAAIKSSKSSNLPDNLQPCRTCGELISTTAAKCPRCGEDVPTKGKIKEYAVYLAIIIAVGIYLKVSGWADGPGADIIRGIIMWVFNVLDNLAGNTPRF